MKRNKLTEKQVKIILYFLEIENSGNEEEDMFDDLLNGRYRNFFDRFIAYQRNRSDLYKHSIEYDLDARLELITMIREYFKEYK